MQAAEVAHEFIAGSQQQVIGVGEQDLRPHLLHLPRFDGAHRRARRDRHVDRRLDDAVGGVQQTGARAVAFG